MTNYETKTRDSAAVIVFAGLAANALTAFALQAWMTFGFAAKVWVIPTPLCVALIVALDVFAIMFMILTYLLRGSGWPRFVATCVFLFAIAAQVFAAEQYGAAEHWTTPVRWFSALPAVFLAASQEGVILWRTHRGDRAGKTEHLIEAESVAGVPVDLVNGGQHPGVYRALGDDPVPPLYIGSTATLARRIVQHRGISGWYPQVKRWTFEPYGTIGDAQIAERALIEAEQPIYNNNHKRPAPRAPQKMPEGIVVEQIAPSVDVKEAAAQEPTFQRHARGGGRPKDPETSSRRDGFARRVIDGGERSADVAIDAGVSKRAVELWVKAYRERQPQQDEQVDPVNDPLDLTDQPVDQQERPQLVEEVTA